MHLPRLLPALLLALAGAWVHAAPPVDALLASAATQRDAGNLNQALAQLIQAKAQAGSTDERMRAAGELGATLAQAHRTAEAQAELQQAYELAGATPARAPYALALGNLALAGKQLDAAQRSYAEARQLAGPNSVVAASAALNQVRLAPPSVQLPLLQGIADSLAQLQATPQQRAMLALNLGHLARSPALGPQALPLAYQSLAQARSLSAGPPSRLQVEALDALAELYESQQRNADALALTQQAQDAAKGLPPGALGELTITLPWRAARLLQAQGQPAQALAAYQRAADALEALRADIPIELDEGGSSYTQLLEPVYLGLVQALLNATDQAGGESQAAYLRRARDALELARQAELQDYLGDRCTVDTVKGGSATVIPAGTAVLYPVLLPTRLELLVETQTQISRYSVNVPAPQVRSEAAALATALRNADAGFLPRAQALYNWLLRPLEPFIAAQRIDTLVVVPDGALRLVPLAALHDGQRYVVDKWAVSTAVGLSMTNTNAPASFSHAALVAGAANFGPVVDKLVKTRQGLRLAELATPLPASRSLRAMRALPNNLDNAPPAAQARSMRELLALPGVTQEVSEVSRILAGDSLLDARFTTGAFSSAAQSGAYRVVHVASHGVFGGDAASSFLLAYDDLLTLDGLQALLQSDPFRRHPLELLSLSACETAEGNERAPLGLAGAALKARARSVLGTLWPVDDEAAVTLMENFYTGWTQGHASKAQALRQAQLKLLHNPQQAHPFYWAPFSLIGNWL
jgi:CHAT domain-containing protein